MLQGNSLRMRLNTQILFPSIMTRTQTAEVSAPPTDELKCNYHFPVSHDVLSDVFCFRPPQARVVSSKQITNETLPSI
jgi:hypothetical protein